MNHDVICIIGMHRSGTSMVARLLNLLGINLGPEEKLVGSTSDNAIGHFEHLGFVGVNNSLLKHFGASWDNPPELGVGWEKDTALNKLTEHARSLIATISASSSWGWKDPRTTIVLSFWQSLIPNLRYVICIRNPLDVARSLAKRDGISLTAGARLWHQYTCAAIHYTNGLPRVLSFYDDYFTSPLREVNKLVEHCGFHKLIDLSRIQHVISKDLRHQDSGTTELLEEVSIPLEYKLFYLGLRALSLDDPLATLNDGEHSESTAMSSGVLVRLMDDFHRQQPLVRTQAALATKELELNELRNTLLRLERDNARLESFADAVRRTWVYRIYRMFNKVSFRTRG